LAEFRGQNLDVGALQLAADGIDFRLLTLQLPEEAFLQVLEQFGRCIGLVTEEQFGIEEAGHAVLREQSAEQITLVGHDRAGGTGEFDLIEDARVQQAVGSGEGVFQEELDGLALSVFTNAGERFPASTRQSAIFDDTTHLLGHGQEPTVAVRKDFVVSLGQEGIILALFRCRFDQMVQHSIEVFQSQGGRFDGVVTDVLREDGGIDHGDVIFSAEA
jgi:hypothetical protein